jgi:hypothetical protein
MRRIHSRSFQKRSWCPNFCFWRDSPHWAMVSSFTRFVDHTQRRTTVGRTPLDEWSARRRDLTWQHSQETHIHANSGICLFLARQPPVGHGLLIHEVSRSELRARLRELSVTFHSWIVTRFLPYSWVDSRPLSATFPIGLRELSVTFPSWIVTRFLPHYWVESRPLSATFTIGLRELSVTFPSWIVTPLPATLLSWESRPLSATFPIGLRELSVTFPSWIVTCFLPHYWVESRPLFATFHNWITRASCLITRLDHGRCLSHSPVGPRTLSVTFHSWIKACFCHIPLLVIPSFDTKKTTTELIS